MSIDVFGLPGPFREKTCFILPIHQRGSEGTFVAKTLASEFRCRTAWIARRLSSFSLFVTFVSGSLGLGFAGPAQGQLEGDEQWFDGPAEVQPGSGGTRPDVDVDGLGRTVIGWDVSESGQATNVYVRLFGIDGTPLIDPTLANITTADLQRYVAVAAANDGSFVAVWVHEVSNVFSINSRYFDANGTPANVVHTINQEAASFSGGALFPDVAALTGGGFVVVWRSATFAGSGDTGTSIQGRLMNSLGEPTGDQFQVNTTTTGSQSYPAVDPLPADDPDGPYDGGFVVAWTEPDVHLRRFQSDGTSGEDDLLIDSNNGARLQLAVGEGNGLVAATWYDSDAIWTRLFNANLVAITDVQRVSAITDTNADDPTITDIGSDGFLIAWNSSTGVGNDNDDRSIQARILGNDGAFDGGQFQANNWIDGRQSEPALGSSSGRLGIAWRSNNGNPVSGTGGVHIIGYLSFICGIFCDGFESADATP